VAAPALDETFRREWPRIVAAVARYTGSLELAEDAVQEAFARAAVARDRGVLINPAAWITTVAKRTAIDIVRRDALLRDRLPLLLEQDGGEPEPDPGGDDRLGMLFAVCTPALDPETRLALALRFVCGVPTAEIADAMLTSHTAMSARLTRAKRRIERDGVRFAPPDTAEVEARLGDVLVPVHLLYTIGHTRLAGDRITSTTITSTAVELARALHAHAPRDRETAGLLALLLLTEGRAAGRMGPDGGIRPLQDADRSRWDDRLIREGLDLAAFALAGGGRFALEAGISGLHSQAPDWARTDWASIARLYDRLVERWPSPAAQVARLVAHSFLPGGEAEALARLDGLLAESETVARQALAARADILRRLGRTAEARAAYVAVRNVERNEAVRGYYGSRIRELDDEPPRDDSGERG
jgi:RNA polymerase sigma-70 factor (ECF subfamily)